MSIPPYDKASVAGAVALLMLGAAIWMFDIALLVRQAAP